MKLKPGVKKLWVEALRSGGYKQGGGRLRSGDKFCCLGVLCDLYGDKWVTNEANSKQPTTYLGKAAYLPKEVCIFAFETYTGHEGCPQIICPVDNKTYFLTHLNDEGVPFEQIADLIEESL